MLNVINVQFIFGKPFMYKRVCLIWYAFLSRGHMSGIMKDKELSAAFLYVNNSILNCSRVRAKSVLQNSWIFIGLQKEHINQCFLDDKRTCDCRKAYIDRSLNFTILCRQHKPVLDRLHMVDKRAKHLYNMLQQGTEVSHFRRVTFLGLLPG